MDAKPLYVDEEIAPLLLELVRGAKSKLVFVTPYVDLTDWRHMLEALALAAQRRVTIMFVVRAEPNAAGTQTIEWLQQIGARVHVVEGLHAKLYMSEQTVIWSSMNLTQGSTRNSHDVAAVVSQPDQARRMREYVDRTLMPLGVAVSDLGPSPAPASRNTIAGHCVRCGSNVPLDRSRPLCESCFAIWAEYANPDYIENFCHACGAPAPTTYATPLCQSCYRRTRR